MSEIFFTSDPHLGHDKEFVYKARGFNSIQEHDEAIIENWNSMILPNDEVYITGDIIMGNDHMLGIEKLKRLNGKLHIKRGNHDSPMKLDFYKQLSNLNIASIETNEWADMIKFGKWMLYLSHHPTILGDFNCIKPGHKNFCLHGHTHSKDRFQFLQYCCYNVAMDAHNNKPVNLSEVQDDLRIKMQELFSEMQKTTNGVD